jgi:hypothetical protein
MLDVHLKSVPEVGRAEKPIDGYEQGSHLSGILLDKRADGCLCFHILFLLSSFGVLWESVRSEPSHEGRIGGSRQIEQWQLVSWNGATGPRIGPLRKSIRL